MWLRKVIGKSNRQDDFEDSFEAIVINITQQLYICQSVQIYDLWVCAIAKPWYCLIAIFWLNFSIFVPSTLCFLFVLCWKASFMLIMLESQLVKFQSSIRCRWLSHEIELEVGTLSLRVVVSLTVGGDFFFFFNLGKGKKASIGIENQNLN